MYKKRKLLSDIGVALKHEFKGSFIFQKANSTSPYRRHEGVQDRHSKGCTAGEWLRQVELGVWVIVVILVEELYVAVIDELCDHGDIGTVHGATSLQHYGGA